MEQVEQGSIALVNGRVFTADADRPWATAVGIWRGITTYVGDDADEARASAGAGAEVIDLAGRTATPGLIDAHTHPMFYGEQLLGLDLTTPTSIEEILRLIGERVASGSASEPIVGWGYYQLSLRENRLPTLAEMDAIAPEHPVVLTHRSGHEMIVNSAAMRRAGITQDTPDPVGGYFERDDRGEPTGTLIENAMEAMRVLEREPGPEQWDARLRRVTEQFLRYGITSTTDANVTSADAMRSYLRVQANASQPRMRFNLMLGHWTMLDPSEELGLMTGIGDQWLRTGAMKFFLDGTEGMRTAKLSEPFADDPDNTGMWMFPPEEFRERVMRAHRAGWQCATHAIGDAAIELTLDAYRDAQQRLPRLDTRHRIEHASLMRPDLIERMAREGVLPIPGSRFASNDYPVLIERFGLERMRWYQPWSSWMERNVPVAASSDAPVQTPDPAKSLKAIVTSRAEHNRDLTIQSEERLALEEALVAYTRNAAFASHQEHQKGALRPGMLGDVTVFNTDIFALDPLDLDTIRADLTIVDGVVVFQG